MTDGETRQLRHYWWQHQGAILSLKPASNWKQKRPHRVKLLKIETKISETIAGKGKFWLGLYLEL